MLVRSGSLAQAALSGEDGDVLIADAAAEFAVAAFVAITTRSARLM